jgi:hypothetical protein
MPLSGRPDDKSPLRHPILKQAKAEYAKLP